MSSLSAFLKQLIRQVDLSIKIWNSVCCIFTLFDILSYSSAMVSRVEQGGASASALSPLPVEGGLSSPGSSTPGL